MVPGPLSVAWGQVSLCISMVREPLTFSQGRRVSRLRACSRSLSQTCVS